MLHHGKVLYIRANSALPIKSSISVQREKNKERKEFCRSSSPGYIQINASQRRNRSDNHIHIIHSTMTVDTGRLSKRLKTARSHLRYLNHNQRPLAQTLAMEGVLHSKSKPRTNSRFEIPRRGFLRARLLSKTPHIFQSHRPHI